MVAIINSGYSIRRTFHYNENKVHEGVAKLLMTANYPMEMEDMNQNQRLNMLLKTAAMNADVTRNSVHITLNFAPGEKLSDDKLKAIATEYMERIGFGGQPFLVYKHDDAGHPHMHIVTTKIRLDGSKIDMQNIGRNQSETARKELEIKHGLVRAEDHKGHVFSLKPVDVFKVQYGASETKRAIAVVLDHVLAAYKYTSLHELNAVLNLYNVHAERGSLESRMYKYKGLVYRIINESGKPIGIPIKASLFHNSPTLAYLEKLFIKNDVARQEHKNKVKSIIDFVLSTQSHRSIESLDTALKKSGIRMVVRQNKEGVVYGITYVDFKSKCVFNGSIFGKNYSAKAIQERFRLKPEDRLDRFKNVIKPSKPSLQPQKKASDVRAESSIEKVIDKSSSYYEKSLLDELLQHEYASQAVPFEWKKKKKKKKR